MAAPSPRWVSIVVRRTLFGETEWSRLLGHLLVPQLGDSLFDLVEDES